MANVLGLDTLMILTSISKVAINYGKPGQRDLDSVTLDEIIELDKEGHFAVGSMGPKIQAAVRFLEGGGQRVVIGHLEEAMEALSGKTGTHIIRNEDS
jgi:carbamate kinase